MKNKIINLSYKLVKFMFVFVFCAIATNVPVHLETSDVDVFNKELNIGFLSNPRTFYDEIAAIKIIQHLVFKKAPIGLGIPDYETREPENLIRNRQGLCYDRSRTLDKAFDYINLPTRHVYLLYRQNRGFWSAMFHYGQSSHAVTEVKTSKGWMVVDSNEEWIALTRDGQVVNADDVWKRSSEFDSIPIYLKSPWWAIRGMYSRKGQLYPPYILFPDINWPNFFSWLILDSASNQ
jgi:hypothetical protein